MADLSIIQAAEDPQLFLPYLTDGDSLETWKNWKTFLRTLYGLPIEESEHDLIRHCTGRDPSRLPSDGFDEALLLCGRRSGKSKMMGLVGAYEGILTNRHKRVSRGEIPLVVIVSPSRSQSGIIFNYMQGLFTSTEILANELDEERKDGFKLRNGVEIRIVTGDPRSVRGYTLVAAIVDEVSHFGFSEESKVRSDAELIRSLKPALLTTGGRLLSVGTPYAERGYSYETFKRGYGNDDAEVLVWSGPSLTMNPTLPAKVVQRAIDEDPVAARVEYVVEPGLFRSDVDSFITRSEVENLVVRGRKELPPQLGTKYASFADVSGGRHDDAALCIAHQDAGLIINDSLQRFKAPHDPYQVVASMAACMKRYGIDRCSGDAYAAEWVKSAFESQGIRYERVMSTVWKTPHQKHKVAKSKSQLYIELLPRLHSGEVELLDDEVLIHQLSSLQRRTRSGMRDAIDHPPGGHDDVANALAGGVDAASQIGRVVTVGVAFGGKSDSSGVRKNWALSQHEQNAKRFEKEQEEWLRERNDDSLRGALNRGMKIEVREHGQL